MSDIYKQFSRAPQAKRLGAAIRDTPRHLLTIRELVTLAFVEHFQHGATPAELKAKIQTAYGREIDSGSIRPNLGRLRDDGIVNRAYPPKWILHPEAGRIVSQIYFDDGRLETASPVTLGSLPSHDRIDANLRIARAL